MRLSLIFILFTFCSINSRAQSGPEGKTFRALTGTSCAKMVNGGCTFFTYCTLSFDKDSVFVSYHSKASCSDSIREARYDREHQPIGKMHSWKMKKNIITITGFSNYGPLEMQEKKLYGKHDHDKPGFLVFENIENK
jgi:predicted metal-dependent RNase